MSKTKLRRTCLSTIGYAQMYPIVYNGDLRLLASSSNVTYGDSVTFTPTYDGVAGPAGRWRWVPADTSDHDTVACAAFASPCKKKMVGSGTMWVYTGTSAGDSASKAVTVLPRRKLLLTPSDTIWVDSGATVQFTASGEGGAALTNVHWSSDDEATIANRAKPRGGRGPGRMSEASGVASSTCVDGVLTCQDVAIHGYVRSVTATVDDSVQTQSVVIEAADMATSPSSDVMPNEPGNPKERLWCLNPLRWTTCSKAKELADSAYKFSFDSATAHNVFPADNIYDAWRHAYWSALLTYEFGVTVAKQIGDNHEYGEIDSSNQGRHNASCMDLTNNQHGREIAVAHQSPRLSMIDLWALITQATNLQATPFNCPNTKPW